LTFYVVLAVSFFPIEFLDVNFFFAINGLLLLLNSYPPPPDLAGVADTLVIVGLILLTTDLNG
jgi:hypothetical protein